MKAAIVFDFDDTLCFDSTNFYLKNIGIDTEQFWLDCRYLVEVEEFDPVLAYMQKIIELKNDERYKSFLTKKELALAGEKLLFFPGVEKFFVNIKRFIAENFQNLELEFYIISSGLEQLIKNSVIAANFKAVYASAFAYDKNESISLAKRALSFTDKTRYLFAISKGINAESYLKNPWLVNNLSVKFAIPFSNMIYIGDGYSDVPCFALLKKYGGFPFAVYNNQESCTLKKLQHEQRIENAAFADFSKESAMWNLITNSLGKIFYAADRT